MSVLRNHAPPDFVVSIRKFPVQGLGDFEVLDLRVKAFSVVFCSASTTMIMVPKSMGRPENSSVMFCGA